MDDLSSLEATKIVEKAEANAWVELCNAVAPDVAERLGLSIQRRGEITVSTCLMFDDPLSNRAFGLCVAEACSEWTVAELVAHFRSFGLRNYALQISPLRWPEGLEAWLRGQGLAPRSPWAKVIRDNRSLPEHPPSWEIRKITRQEGGVFRRTVAAAYRWPPLMAEWMGATVDRPGWHHYLAYASGRAVGTGALYVAGDVGWLGIGSTLPSFRRRGVHHALMTRRIHDALQMGCRWLVAETAEGGTSYRNMLRMGFRLVYLRDNFSERRSSSESIVRGAARRMRRALTWKLRNLRSSSV